MIKNPGSKDKGKWKIRSNHILLKIKQNLNKKIIILSIITALLEDWVWHQSKSNKIY